MGTITVDLRKVGMTINKPFYPLLWDRHRYLVMKGGAGSGKSVFAAQKLAYRSLVEPGHRFLVIRKVARTLRESCFAEIVSAIRRWGFRSLFEVHPGDMRITCTATGSEFIFVGLDDPEKLKSIHDPTGAWIEEATELMPGDLAEVGRRMRGRRGEYVQIVLTFNPISIRHWIKGRFIDSDQHGLTRVHTSTFHDNAFLAPDYLTELEDLRRRDPEMYEVYGKGQWGMKLSGLVYGGDIIVPREWYPRDYDYTIYGLDFGFNNPTALIEINYHDNTGWIVERLYATGLTTEDLINRMTGMNISRSDYIYADCAEPDRIEQITRAGFNVHPSEKGSGSVGAGIVVVKAAALRSCPENANFNAEWQSYAWKRDKYGNILDEAEAMNNHAMDALRYAVHGHLAAFKEPDIY